MQANPLENVATEAIDLRRTETRNLWKDLASIRLLPIDRKNGST